MPQFIVFDAKESAYFLHEAASFVKSGNGAYRQVGENDRTTSPKIKAIIVEDFSEIGQVIEDTLSQVIDFGHGRIYAFQSVRSVHGTQVSFRLPLEDFDLDLNQQVFIRKNGKLRSNILK